MKPSSRIHTPVSSRTGTAASSLSIDASTAVQRPLSAAGSKQATPHSRPASGVTPKPRATKDEEDEVLVDSTGRKMFKVWVGGVEVKVYEKPPEAPPKPLTVFERLRLQSDAKKAAKEKEDRDKGGREEKRPSTTGMGVGRRRGQEGAEGRPHTSGVGAVEEGKAVVWRHAGVARSREGSEAGEVLGSPASRTPLGAEKRHARVVSPQASPLVSPHASLVVSPQASGVVSPQASLNNVSLKASVVVSPKASGVVSPKSSLNNGSLKASVIVSPKASVGEEASRPSTAASPRKGREVRSPPGSARGGKSKGEVDVIQPLSITVRALQGEAPRSPKSTKDGKTKGGKEGRAGLWVDTSVGRGEEEKAGQEEKGGKSPSVKPSPNVKPSPKRMKEDRGGDALSEELAGMLSPKGALMSPKGIPMSPKGASLTPSLPQTPARSRGASRCVTPVAPVVVPNVLVERGVVPGHSARAVYLQAQRKAAAEEKKAAEEEAGGSTVMIGESAKGKGEEEEFKSDLGQLTRIYTCTLRKTTRGAIRGETMRLTGGAGTRRLAATRTTKLTRRPSQGKPRMRGTESVCVLDIGYIYIYR